MLYTSEQTSVENLPMANYPGDARPSDKRPRNPSSSSSTEALPIFPLDRLPPKFLARFPRFSTTTETGAPDLPMEEVTFNRFSVDEEGIISIPLGGVTAQDFSERREKARESLHSTISNQSMRLKRASGRLKRTSSSFFSTKSARSEISTVVPEPVGDNGDAADTFGPTRSISPLLPPVHGIRKPSLTRIKRGSKDLVVRAISRLSAFKENRSVPDKERETKSYPISSIPLGPSPRIPLPALHNITNFTYGPSSTTINSYHTAQDRLLYGRSSFYGSEQNLPRSVSLGSINELRSQAFTRRQPQLSSRSSTSFRRTSFASLYKSSTSRPGSRPTTLCEGDELRTLRYSKREPLFVDLEEGHSVDFIFPPNSDVSEDPIPTQARPLSMPASCRTLRKESSRPTSIRTASIQEDFKNGMVGRKIPTFVPAHILKEEVGYGSAASPLNTLSPAGVRLAHSNPMQEGDPEITRSNSPGTASRASQWSTCGQFGPQDEIERDAETISDISSSRSKVVSMPERIVAVLTSPWNRSGAVHGSDDGCEKTSEDDGSHWLGRTCGFCLQVFDGILGAND